MVVNWLVEEQAEWSAGYRCVAGIDEAGRGALAGPVVAACVVLPRDFIPAGVNDSKQLKPEARERCYDVIISSCSGYGVGIVQPIVIDRINILKATHEAMRQALASVPSTLQPDIALIDGLPVHPFPLVQRSIVGGDALSASIAAASIIAKVTRDRLMTEMHERFPNYLFAKHKGYGTAEHLRAIAEHGPCSEHRQSFKPVRLGICEQVERTEQHALQFPDR